MRKKNCKNKIEWILLLLIIFLPITSVISLDLNNTQKNNERPEQPGLKSSNDAWYPSFNLSVGNGPSSVFVEDVNNDGYNDIVTTNYPEDDISIILWNSTVEDWDIEFRKAVGEEPYEVFIADVNNDGYNDIVTGNRDSMDVSIILWNSTIEDWDEEFRIAVGGGWTTGPQSVFIADANNDGYNDIVTANVWSDDISIFLWDSVLGDWESEITKSVGLGPYDVFIGDVNNDGYNDIVTANLGDDDISIFLWNPTVGYWNAELKKGTVDGTFSVFIEDVNNDGYNDIVTSIWGTNEVLIFLWNSTIEDWDLEIRKPVGTHPGSVFVEDIDNDGYNDIISANSGTNDVSIFLWDSVLGDWDAEIRKSVGSYPYSLFIADVNNDGYNDIVTANMGSADVSIFLWNTPPSITINQPLQYELFGDSGPDFNISVRDRDLDSMWYTLDNGITNISFFQYNGSIDQSEWEKLEDGTVIIRFYANDTAGNVGYAFVVVGKNVWDSPNPPVNIRYHSGYHNITLEWDPPLETAPVSHYNVYRGDIPGGGKNFVGNSETTTFTDTIVEFNKDYYYIIKAENVAGESNASEEIYAIAGPYIRWKTPEENKRVILPVGVALFKFSHDYMFLDDVRLYLNGIDYGSVKDEDNTILDPYNSLIDGPVNAVLYGYEIEFPNPIVNDSRNFIFGKLTSEAIEILDEDTEFLGEQLYLILHDPNGDNSYSGFAEQTGLSFGVGSSVSVSTGFEISTGWELFGLGGDASLKLELKSTDKHDFRLEIKEETELTSSLDNFNKDYIGPGYGDTYWGEAWTINWQFKGIHRTYFNGTDRYENPRLYYGIIRSGEVLLNDNSAPAEWRVLNPVYNNFANVEWDDNITVDGGNSYSYTKEVTTSNIRTIAFQMNLDTSISIIFPGVELTFSFGLEVQTYMESEVTNVYTTSYTIYDDESTDLISMQRGVDQTFGTPIFRTNSLVCKTSNPLEHNTIDYIPPVIEFPNIEFDSSLDGLAPCEDDSPIVQVDIFDEGGVQSALIFYSINDGTNWDSSILSEQIANPGTWEGLIPAQDHGTTVLWYIKVWDSGGSYSNRTDPHGNPFRYTVINRAPTIHIITPNGNEVFEYTIRIEWSAMDPDDDDLTFTIAYNLANTGWRLIESGVSGNYYDWDISGIEFCDTVLIKVTVDDGFGGSTYDESDYVFTIGEPEPSVSKPSEANWTLILVIAFISLAAAVSTIVIFIRRSRSVQE